MNAHQGTKATKDEAPCALPAGVTYDGMMSTTKLVVHLFTDALTQSTFGVEASELDAPRVARELAELRARFAAAEAAPCLDDLAHAGPIGAAHCDCPANTR